jgi:hypothetical protein
MVNPKSLPVRADSFLRGYELVRQQFDALLKAQLLTKAEMPSAITQLSGLTVERKKIRCTGKFKDFAGARTYI